MSDAHRLNREQYGAVAANYAVSPSHAGGDDLAWLSSRAASVAPGVALDVACGGGFSTRALAAAGHRVLATDLTPESVAAARGATESARVAWAIGAAERLPVRTESVNVAACRIAPHHFADVAAFVDEVARVLIPGGMFLLVDTTVPEDDDLARWLDDVERRRDPSHQRSWPPSRWRAVVSGARLRVEETQAYRKRHELEPWLARSGCVGDAAEDVRRRFREAPDAARAAYLIDDVSYTDTKLCLRATKS
ncbi:MAG TPA: class I SAM-dependent methyltransferase [Frankiaceae bacterium]|jgi:SAM-dependent methyltransferase|nr:class I SAM-dependent methyltransferase [Frankiaceae bacterium]